MQKRTSNARSSDPKVPGYVLLLQVVGSGLPQSVGVVVALLVTATCAGLIRSAGLMADDEEVEVVSNAVQNADR